LIGAVERRGNTVVPLQLYWKDGRAKLDRDRQRDKGRIMKAARRQPLAAVNPL
jgi:tmRNA-binding protein